MRRADTDVLIIGAGPAGASAAIRLARLGWKVTLVEQTVFPRQKVCGECLGPASLELLDELDLGSAVSEFAGPAIRQVAWMVRDQTIVAEMPACLEGRHAYGRAIGRDCLDTLLLEHARSHGVDIVQPATVRRVCGVPGDFDCVYERRCEGVGITDDGAGRTEHLKAAVVIDAHGSWERGPECPAAESRRSWNSKARPSDLLAFKAIFQGASLAPGLLPVLCLPGGYGGMVVSDRGRTTVACCLQRSMLRQRRARLGGSAGDVVEAYLRSSCSGLAAALCAARREDNWHAVGPLRTGIHPRGVTGIARIGNAAAEAHPLIGEGICMALQSAAILAKLCGYRPKALRAADIVEMERNHAAICRKEFSGRIRLAKLYAQVAMHPSLTNAASMLMKIWPGTLTAGAQLAGKARRGVLELASGRAAA